MSHLLVPKSNQLNIVALTHNHKPFFSFVAMCEPGLINPFHPMLSDEPLRSSIRPLSRCHLLWHYEASSIASFNNSGGNVLRALTT